MSENSLPSLEHLNLRRYPSRLREAAGRLIGRLRRGYPGESRDGGQEAPATEPRGSAEAAGSGRAPVTDIGPEVGEFGEAARERAAITLRRFLKENDTNVERAARTRDQAERLELEGTPSDSARNRAERAREEVADVLSRLIRSLSASGDHETARAVEAEAVRAIRLDPPIRPSEIRR